MSVWPFGRWTIEGAMISANAQHVRLAHREDNEAVWRDIVANACCCSRLRPTLIGPMLVLAANSEAQWCEIFRCSF